MGAKQKLNSANAVLALVIAAIMGMAFGSWIAFVVAAIILVAASVVSGDIRRQEEERRTAHGAVRRGCWRNAKPRTTEVLFFRSQSNTFAGGAVAPRSLREHGVQPEIARTSQHQIVGVKPLVLLRFQVLRKRGPKGVESVVVMRPSPSKSKPAL